MLKTRLLVFVLLGFSVAETLLFLVGASFVSFSAQGTKSPLSFFLTSSTYLAPAGWVAAVCCQILVRGNRTKSVFTHSGFDSEVYNLMVKMKGRQSRLRILDRLETPSHRLELAESTGMDWKEVDRQLNVLERYDLVKVFLESGSVKIYETTDKGRQLVRLMSDLEGKPS